MTAPALLTLQVLEAELGLAVKLLSVGMQVVDGLVGSNDIVDVGVGRGGEHLGCGAKHLALTHVGKHAWGAASSADRQLLLLLHNAVVRAGLNVSLAHLQGRGKAAM